MLEVPVTNCQSQKQRRKAKSETSIRTGAPLWLRHTPEWEAQAGNFRSQSFLNMGQLKLSLTITQSHREKGRQLYLGMRCKTFTEDEAFCAV